jgi:hypothetical protein
MEQRPLRLGDILDDYCPRERRVTNHAVVAMIEDNVKQTRCSTCDAEHVYKGGKAPRRKKSDTTGALYKEVLAGIEDPAARPVQTAASLESDAMTEHDDESSDITEPDEIDEVAEQPDEDDSQLQMLPPDEGPVHRPLIRAQLPRTEGMKIERQAPEFTIRQNNGRGPAGGGFRGRNNGGGGGGGQHAGSGGGGQRFGRGGPHRGSGSGGGHAGNGGGRGQGGGFGRGPSGPGGGGGNQQRRGGPPKRSR